MEYLTLMCHKANSDLIEGNSTSTDPHPVLGLGSMKPTNRLEGADNSKKKNSCSNILLPITEVWVIEKTGSTSFSKSWLFTAKNLFVDTACKSWALGRMLHIWRVPPLQLRHLAFSEFVQYLANNYWWNIWIGSQFYTFPNYERLTKKPSFCCLKYIEGFMLIWKKPSVIPHLHHWDLWMFYSALLPGLGFQHGLHCIVCKPDIARTPSSQGRVVNRQCFSSQERHDLPCGSSWNMLPSHLEIFLASWVLYWKPSWKPTNNA